MSKLKTRMDPKTFARIIHAANQREDEVGGVFEVERHSSGLICANMEILKQYTAERGMEVSFDLDALDAWREAHLPANDEEGLPYGDYGIWHSHVKSGTGKSATDREFVEDHTGRGLLIYMIVNQQGNRTVECFTYAGGRRKQEATLIEVPIDFEVMGVLTLEEQKEIAQAVKENVIARPTASVVVDYPFARGESYGDGYFHYGQRGGADVNYWRCVVCGLNAMKCACKQRTQFVSPDEYREIAELGEEHGKKWGRAAAREKRKEPAEFSITFATSGKLILYEDGAGITCSELPQGMMNRISKAGVNLKVLKRLDRTGDTLVLPADGRKWYVRSAKPGPIAL